MKYDEEEIMKEEEAVEAEDLKEKMRRGGKDDERGNDERERGSGGV